MCGLIILIIFVGLCLDKCFPGYVRDEVIVMLHRKVQEMQKDYEERHHQSTSEYSDNYFDPDQKFNHMYYNMKVNNLSIEAIQIQIQYSYFAIVVYVIHFKAFSNKHVNGKIH